MQYVSHSTKSIYETDVEQLRQSSCLRLYQKLYVLIRARKYQKISGGACPQTPQRITNHKCCPPHFCHNLPTPLNIFLFHFPLHACESIFLVRGGSFTCM